MKRRSRARRHRATPAVLQRLKPHETAAVLSRLLEARPELASEAEEIARSLLCQSQYEDIATELENEVRALDYDVLNARAGGHERGYVEPTEAAWEILEETVEPFLDDLKRRLELGLKTEALEICQGLVLGCYRLSEREGGDVLGWAPDFPAEVAANAVEIWRTGGGDSKRRGGGGGETLPLSAAFLSMIPKWIPMIERLHKETK